MTEPLSTIPQLQYLAAKTLQVLDKLLDDSQTPALAKVEAAKAVLDYASQRRLPEQSTLHVACV